MQSSTEDDPPDSPDAPAVFPNQGPDEVVIDIEDPADSEPLGEYPTIEDYFRSLLEEFVHEDAQWLLGCLDMQQVRARFESSGRYAYRCEGGKIYRSTR